MIKHVLTGLTAHNGASTSSPCNLPLMANKLDELFRERTRVDDGILRLSHLRGGNEFHRIGDSLRGADRGDAVAHLLLGSILDNQLPSLARRRGRVSLGRDRFSGDGNSRRDGGGHGYSRHGS